MFYCNVGILDVYQAINKGLALREAVKSIRKKISEFDSCYSAAVEFVKIYQKHVNGIKVLTENEIKEVASLGANVCLLCKSNINADVEEKSLIYSDVYSFIYNEMKTINKNIIIINKPMTQYVMVKKVRRRYH